MKLLANAALQILHLKSTAFALLTSAGSNLPAEGAAGDPCPGPESCSVLEVEVCVQILPRLRYQRKKLHPTYSSTRASHWGQSRLVVPKCTAFSCLIRWSLRSKVCIKFVLIYWFLYLIYKFDFRPNQTYFGAKIADVLLDCMSRPHMVCHTPSPTLHNLGTLAALENKMLISGLWHDISCINLVL